MDKQEVMYVVMDENGHLIYTIVHYLDEAMDIARMLNDEASPQYHHYVVEECTRAYGEAWLQVWKKVMNL